MESVILEILFYLFWPLVIIIGIIWGIIYFIRRRTRGSGQIESEWYDKSFFSKEDFVSQFFILFSLILSNIALWIINQQIGGVFTGITIFLISSLIGVAVGYHLKAIWSFILGTIGLVMWWFYQASVWITQTNIYTGANPKPIGNSYGLSAMRAIEIIKPVTLIAAFVFIAIIFYLLGRIFEREDRYKRLAKFYSFFGIISITGSLFIFSTNSGLEMIETAMKGVSFFNSFPISVSFAFFLGTLAIMLIYSFKEKLLFFQEAIAVGFLAVFFMFIALLPEQAMYVSSGLRYSYSHILSATGIFWAVIFNVLVFVEILGIVFLGYLRRQNFLINLGAISLFLLIIVKYFDWFGNLAGGAFLVGAGILLFVVGWSMEKGRRYMISKIQNTEVR